MCISTTRTEFVVWIKKQSYPHSRRVCVDISQFYPHVGDKGVDNLRITFNFKNSICVLGDFVLLICSNLKFINNAINNANCKAIE